MTQREREILERLQYTFSVGSYAEIDQIVLELKEKAHWKDLLRHFFEGCSCDEKGELICTAGFFREIFFFGYAQYALFSLLNFSDPLFLLKYQIKRVVLSDRSISEPFRFPKGIFSLPSLVTLVADEKDLTSLPEEIGQLRHTLRALRLRGNQLSQVPKSLWRLSRLTYLNLEQNNLSIIPDEVEKLKNLRVLELSGNRIHTLSPSISRLPLLRKLDLSINLLPKLPEALAYCPCLTKLRISFNKMTASAEAAWEKTCSEARQMQGELFSEKTR